MAFNELKKILSNRWIIFFLVILTAFNIFFSINQINNIEKDSEEEKTQKEKIVNYPQYIKQINKNLSAISSFELFSNQGDYNTKNAKKVMKAYEKVKNVKPVYGNYTAVSNTVTTGLSDVILFVLVLQCVALVIDSDRKKGMMKLLKSCKNGRCKLILSKIKALFMSDVLCVLGIYVPLFTGLMLYYGCSNLNNPIQSVPEFYESDLNITILQYLLMFLALKCVAVFAYSLILLLYSIVFENVGIFYAVSIITLAVSMVLKVYILWDYKIGLFKVMSPATLSDIMAITCKYYNINIAGIPVSLFGLSVAFMLTYIVTMIVISAVIFSNNISIKLNITKPVRRKIKAFTKGMTLFEFKKVVFVNKGIILIIVLMIAQSYMAHNINTERSEYQKHYTKYMNTLQGPQTDDTEKFIKDEEERFKLIDKKYTANVDAYTNGKLNADAFDVISEKYYWDILPKDAFKDIKKHNSYLTKLSKENKSGWFINDIGVNYLFNSKEIYNETFAWILMMMVMVLLITSCYSYDEDTQMNKLLTTMYNGTKKLQKIKVKIVLLLSTLLYLVTYIPFWIKIFNSYEMSAIWAPAISLEKFSNISANVPIIVLLIAEFVIKYLIMLVAMAVVILMSKKCKGHIKKITFSFLVVVMPLIVMAV